MSNYHLSQKKGQEDWNVRKEGMKKPSAIVSLQAENLAKQFSSNNGGGEVRIHLPNGGANKR